MKIKSIEFIFENTESLHICGSHIGNLVIDDIKHSIKRVAVNSIMEFFTCQNFQIEINKAADGHYVTIDNSISEYTKFERLTNFRDVVCVSLTCDDGTQKDFFVNWVDDGCDYKNKLQQAFISNNGHLYLSVLPEKEMPMWYNIECNFVNQKGYQWIWTQH